MRDIDMFTSVLIRPGAQIRAQWDMAGPAQLEGLVIWIGAHAIRIHIQSREDAHQLAEIIIAALDAAPPVEPAPAETPQAQFDLMEALKASLAVSER